jgi:hypothetical protein
MSLHASDDDRHDWIPFIKPSEADKAGARLLPRSSVADRIRATIRHRDYWKDLNTFLSKDKKPRLGRFNTTKLFWEPNSPVANRWNLPATIVDKQHACRLLDYYKGRPWRSSEPIRVSAIQPRFVLLSVDLSETAHRLHQVFGLFLDFYQQELGWAEPHRNRPFECNPFEVYDLVEEKHLNISKAAQKVFKKTFARGEGPAYSPEAQRMYVQASRAYKWAKNIIAHIGQEAGH